MFKYVIQCLGNDYFRDPVANNLMIKKDGLHFGVLFIGSTKVTIPWDRLLKIAQTVSIADTKVSYGKALAGGLIFGPVGAILGGVSGGRTTERVLSIIFLDESNEMKSISFDSKSSLPIRNKIESEMQKRFGTTDRTES